MTAYNIAVATDRDMARWLRIVLIVSSIFAGWAALGVLTFDDNLKVDVGR